MADISRASLDAALEPIGNLLDQQDPYQMIPRRDGRTQPIETYIFKSLIHCIAVVLGRWLRLNAESRAKVWGGRKQITMEDLQDYLERVFKNWSPNKVPEIIYRPRPLGQGFLCGVIRQCSGQAKDQNENKERTKRKNPTGKEPAQAPEEQACPSSRPGRPVYLQVVPSTTSGPDFMRCIGGELRFVDEKQNYVAPEDVECHPNLDSREVLNNVAQKTISEKKNEEEWVKDYNINLGVFVSQVEIWKKIHGDDERTLKRIIAMNGSGMESVIRSSVDQLFNFLEQPRNSLETHQTLGNYLYRWELVLGDSSEE